MENNIALQLYTLRDEMEKDFLGTLSKVAEIGYKGVEFAGFFDLEAEVIKAKLEELNLEAVGSHTNLDLLRNNLDQVLEYNLAIGNKNIVVPYAKAESYEGYLQLAQELTNIAEKCAEKGLNLCYHNHAHELDKYKEVAGLDILYQNTAKMLAEPDTYWLFYAGVDPVAYIKKYAARVPLIHLKDMKAETKEFAEVGEGIMDIKSIIEVGKEIKAKWFIVEQDKCARPALESVKISYDNLFNLI